MMCSPEEVMDIIMGVAKEDERIRAVIMTGSRANPEAPKDQYQDFDILYLVKDAKDFYNNVSWIEEKFGSPAIMQLPELMKHPLLPAVNDGHFTYLMIFPDGNRIDLTVDDKPYVHDGEPIIILLDKDDVLGDLEPNKEHWHVKPPIEAIYHNVCNEFWWCLNNVAKGIARDEIPYAKMMLDYYVREMLHEMISWSIGIDTKFSVSTGKMGKYYKKYMTSDTYDRFIATYSGSNEEEIWYAVFVACDLFHEMAVKVAGYFGFYYKQEEEDGMRGYLKKVRG